jgi:hypothetical protein
MWRDESQRIAARPELIVKIRGRPLLNKIAKGSTASVASIGDEKVFPIHGVAETLGRFVQPARYSLIPVSRRTFSYFLPPERFGVEVICSS